MSLDKAALESLRRERDSERGALPGARQPPYLRWLAIGALRCCWSIVCAGACSAARSQVATVTVEAAEGADGAVLNASGYVVARRLATVSSKVTGRVSEVLFEEGAEVEAGQVLARLDATTVQAEYNVSVQSLEAARRSLREIEVRLADARRTLERNRNLLERKLIAQSVVDAPRQRLQRSPRALPRRKQKWASPKAGSRSASRSLPTWRFARRSKASSSPRTPSPVKWFLPCRPAAASPAPVSQPSWTWTRAKSKST